MVRMLARTLSALLLLFAASVAWGTIWDTVPDEQLKALQLERSATPKQLYDALTKRWEGNLTELELQWGRTIGQFPSPYTGGNPLVAPYQWDQGP